MTSQFMDYVKSAVRATILAAAILLIGSATDAAASRFGIGAMFRDEADFGLQARWTMVKDGKINFVPQAGYFFDPEFFDFDLDLHYRMGQDSKPELYLLGGLDLLTDFDDSEFGLNLGGGLSTSLSSSLDGFAEVKYVVSDFDGIAVNLGIHF